MRSTRTSVAAADGAEDVFVTEGFIFEGFAFEVFRDFFGIRMRTRSNDTRMSNEKNSLNCRTFHEVAQLLAGPGPVR